MERRFGSAGPPGATGVPLPVYGGNGTPVRRAEDERDGPEGRGRVVDPGNGGGAPAARVVADRRDASGTAGPAGVVEAAAVPAGAGSGLRAVPDADGVRLDGQPRSRRSGGVPELVPGVQKLITRAHRNRR